MSKISDIINNKATPYSNLVMLFVAVVTFVIFLYDRSVKMEGTFMVTINDKEVYSAVNRNILVYMDKDSTDLAEIDGIFPIISNPDEYALSHVSLTYKIEADSVSISYSNDYKIDDISKGKKATNINDNLYSKSDFPSPFVHFVMKDNGQAAINLRATYQGVKDPFDYRSTIYSKKIIKEDESKRERSIFIDADIFFTRNPGIDKIDIFILDQDSVCLYENYTQDSAYRKYSYNYGRMRGYKPRQNTESTSNMPWYMYIVGGLLGVVFIFGAFFLVYILMMIIINDFQKNNSEFKYGNIVIFTVVSSVLSYIALYYLLQVIFPEVINLNWQLIVCIYGIIGTIIIVRLLIEKLFRTTKNQ